MNTKTQRRIFKPLVFVASLGPLAWIVWAIYSDSVFGTHILGVDPIMNINRELGDWALIFIVITLALRPAAELTKFREFTAYRRMMGLYAFFYAVTHVATYVMIDLEGIYSLSRAGSLFVDDIIKRKFITVGIIALILLIPLAITSTKGMVKRLGGRAWQRLHWLVYPISLLVVFHFYMMIRADFSRPIIYGAIIVALLAYRYWVKWQRDNKRKARASAAKTA